MPCDFVNSNPVSASTPSPSAAEAAGLAAGAARSPGLVSPRANPAASPGLSTAGSSIAAGAGPGGDSSLLPAENSAAAAFAFLEWSLNGNKAAAAAAAGSQPVSHGPVADAMFDSAAFPNNNSSVACLAVDDDLALNMTDLSLLHHFTTSTASDLNPWNTGLQEWWTHEVPRVGFRYPFVMRSLLALAGLHMAYLAQQRQQQQQQQEQQQQAQSPAANNNADGSGQSPAVSTGIPMVGIGSTVTGSAVTSPEESYRPRASTSEATTRAFHLSRAIEQHKLAGQTASSMLLTMDRSTSAPMYVFSVVTMIISMAMPRQAGPVDSWDNVGVAEWARLMRGVKTIAEAGEALHSEGDMLWGTFNEKLLPRALQLERQELKMRRGRAPLPGVNVSSPGDSTRGSSISDGLGGNSDGGNSKKRSRWYLMHEPPLASLREAILSETLEGPGVDDEKARQLCVVSLDNLQEVFESFLDQGENVQTVRLIFSWLIRVDQQFLDNLSRHTPHSLLLFAYFAVLLHWTDRAWWMEGWSSHIVESISHILGGNDAPAAYKQWLKWPREQIGLSSLG